MKVTISNVLVMLVNIKHIIIKDCIEFEYKSYDDCITLLGDIADEECLSIEVNNSETVTLTLRQPAALIF